MSKQKRLSNKKKNNAPSQTPTSSQQTTKDKSPVVHQRNKIDHYLTILHRELTPKQKLFIELAMDRKVKLLLISGPAGSTKTYLSVLAVLLKVQMLRWVHCPAKPKTNCLHSNDH